MERSESGSGRFLPLIIAGVLGVSAGGALAPKSAAPPTPPSAPASPPPAESGGPHLDPHLAGGPAWLHGARPALQLLADYFGIRVAPRDVQESTAALEGYATRAGGGSAKEVQRAFEAVNGWSLAPGRPSEKDLALLEDAVRRLTALDLPKDSEVSRQRAGLLEFLRQQQDDEWILKEARKRAEKEHVTVRFVIATMPDYVDSNNDWMFDPSLDAIQRAATALGFLLDRFYLPDWHPEAGASRAEERHTHEHEPGAVLFRRQRKNANELLLVLLPSETATFGLHKEAFLSAVSLVTRWSGEEVAEPLLVLGPTFSGTAPSLHRALEEAFRSGLIPREPLMSAEDQARVLVVSGSASSRMNKRRVEEVDEADGPTPALVKFSSTTVSDNDYEIGLRNYLGEIDERWFYGDKMALIVESNTAWGAGFLSPRATGSSQTDPPEAKPEAKLETKPEAGSATSNTDVVDPQTIADCRAARRRAFPCAKILTFPLHLSRLRGQATARSQTAVKVEGSSSTVSLQLEEPLPPRDRLPSLTPELTSAQVETTMARILDTIERFDLTAVGIYATDKRDHLFLVQEIARRAPNVLLFALEGNLIYLHPDYRPYMRGTVVASSYPLFSPTQQLLQGSGLLLPLQQFSSVGAQGTYNALLALLGQPERMLDYGSGCHSAHEENCGPSVWISVVGNDAIWPLKRVAPQPSVNQGYTWPGLPPAATRSAVLEPPGLMPVVRASGPASLDEASKPILPRVRGMVGWPRSTLLLFVVVVVAVLLHLSIGVTLVWQLRREGVQGPRRASDVCGAWLLDRLERYLPIFEPPDRAARRWRSPDPAKVDRGPQDTRETALRQEYWLSVAACGGALFAVALWLAQMALVGLNTGEDGGGQPSPYSWGGWVLDGLGDFVILGLLAAVVPLGKRWKAGLGPLSLLRSVPILLGILALWEMHEMAHGDLWKGELAGLNVQRAAMLGTLVSPTSVILLFALVVYAWGFWNLRRLRLQAAPFDEKSALCELLGGDHGPVRKEILDALNEPALRVGGLGAFVLVVLVALDVAVGTYYGRPVDGPDMRWLLWAGTTLTTFLVAHTLIYCVRLGGTLLRSLKSLNLHPIGMAFGRVAREPFAWGLSLGSPTGRHLTALVRQARAFVLSIQEREPAFREQFLEIVRDPAYASCGPTRPPRPPEAEIAARDEGNLVLGKGLEIRAGDVPAILGLDSKVREHLEEDIRLDAPFQATAVWAPLERMAFSLVKVLEHGPWARDPYRPPEEPPRDPCHREAEALIALEAGYLLRHLLSRLASGLTLAMAGLVLIMSSHLFYSFPGRGFWLAFDWVCVGLGTVVALTLLVSLEKDTILSRLWATRPGHFDWNGEFVQRILFFGAIPIVTLFVTFFPEVGNSLFAWFEPVRKAIP